MTVTPAQKSLIEEIVNVFETGSPQGDYGEVCTYCDGKGGSRQITYGRSQTTEQGNLQDLLIRYCQNGGAFKAQFAHIIPEIGEVPLWTDREFIKLLRVAGDDPVMRATEDAFFDYDYFTPAMGWATRMSFTLPLSMLVIYDSFIQSGQVLDFLRARFQEKPPSAGGDEKVWIKEYVYVRGEWLRFYDDPSAPEKSALLRKTVYRTGDLMRAVVAGNWDLAQSPFMANGTAVEITLPVNENAVLAGVAQSSPAAASSGGGESNLAAPAGQPAGFQGFPASEATPGMAAAGGKEAA